MDDGMAEESLMAQIAGIFFAKQIAEVSRCDSSSVRSSSNQAPKCNIIAKIVRQTWCKIHRAKKTALQKAIIGKPTLMSPFPQSPLSPSAMLPSLVETPPGRKTVGDVESSTHWMELINSREDPVTMEELIQAKLVNTLFPII